METKEIMEQLGQDWLQNPNLTETELEYLNNYMETKGIMEQLRQEWLQKPNLTGTELEYLNNYYYDDDYDYCEECDMVDDSDNWFWYDGDEYTDYLHIKCNKDKYLEQ